MTIEFTVPGRPVPMARPRVTMHGTYTPKRCRDYKAAVSIAAKVAMVGKEPIEGAVALFIKLGYGAPQSWTKAKRAAASGNAIRPIGRNTGDADNHAKAIMDALTGIVWKDDSQVVCLTVEKWYGHECAEVTVMECGEAGQDAT